MENLVLEKPKLIITPYFVNILTEPEEYKKILPELPSYYAQTLQGLYNTIKKKVAEPLLGAKNLTKEFQKLRDSFSFNLLRISLNNYISHMWQEYPKETEMLFKEGAKWVEITTKKQARLILDKETTEILLGVLKLCIRVSEDSLKLLEHLNIKEFPSALHGIAINLDLCVLSILSSLIEEPMPVNRKRQNLQILILWAKEYSLKYTTELSQFLKKQLSSPQNIELGKKFYAEKIMEFIGSGPKGVYEALLEERRRERTLKNG